MEPKGRGVVKRAVSDARVIARARRTIELESKGIGAMAPRLGAPFLAAISILYECRGKIVLTGVGKSGIIAKKIAATLSSTGTPAIFMHSSEGAHGDLGVITPVDVLMAVSSSGETDEIRQLIPEVKRVGVPIIAITRGKKTSLGEVSDVALVTGRSREACPLGLAPTTSAAAAMALGDALAMALLEKRGFREEDFARIHPGGNLGKKWIRVGELMHREGDIPLVKAATPLLEAVYVMSTGKLGVAIVVDSRGRLKGMITDGDLRRTIEKRVDFTAVSAGEVMTADPCRIGKEEFAVQALRTMEKHSITSLVVTTVKGRVVGLIHMHDLLRAGIV